MTTTDLDSIDVTEYPTVVVALDASASVEQKMVSYYRHQAYLNGATTAAEQGWLVHTASYDNPFWIVVYRRAIIPVEVIRPRAPKIPTIYDRDDLDRIQ